jgi:hypothetical protein
MASLKVYEQQQQHADIPANCQKLSSLEEASLKKWILDMDE